MQSPGSTGRELDRFYNQPITNRHEILFKSIAWGPLTVSSEILTFKSFIGKRFGIILLARWSWLYERK